MPATLDAGYRLRRLYPGDEQERGRRRGCSTQRCHETASYLQTADFGEFVNGRGHHRSGMVAKFLCARCAQDFAHRHGHMDSTEGEQCDASTKS